MTDEQKQWLADRPDWRVVSPDRHHRDYARACNGRGKWPRDRVLCPDGALLPGDSMRFAGRIYVRPVGSE